MELEYHLITLQSASTCSCESAIIPNQSLQLALRLHHLLAAFNAQWLWRNFLLRHNCALTVILLNLSCKCMFVQDLAQNVVHPDKTAKAFCSCLNSSGHVSMERSTGPQAFPVQHSNTENILNFQLSVPIVSGSRISAGQRQSSELKWFGLALKLYI